MSAADNAAEDLPSTRLAPSGDADTMIGFFTFDGGGGKVRPVYVVRGTEYLGDEITFLEGSWRKEVACEANSMVGWRVTTLDADTTVYIRVKLTATQ